MRRPLRVQVSRRRGTACPITLAEATADYLLGRTNTRPTFRINATEPS